MQVTGEMVRDAMIENNITTVDHHECSMCHHMVYYERYGNSLYFNPGCGCSYGHVEPRTWESAAEWINMQTHEEHRINIMKKFGLIKND